VRGQVSKQQFEEGFGGDRRLPIDTSLLEFVSVPRIDLQQGLGEFSIRQGSGSAIGIDLHFARSDRAEK
jgi:hypothetical protein